MSIHSEIKARRTALNWSHERLAAEVSKREGLQKPLAWQTVQQWEQEPNGTAPKRKRLGFVAAALGATVGELLSSPPGEAAESTAGPMALPQALEVLGQALAFGLPDKQRAELAEALSAWARYEGRARYRETVAELLGDVAPVLGLPGPASDHQVTPPAQPMRGTLMRADGGPMPPKAPPRIYQDDKPEPVAASRRVKG